MKIPIYIKYKTRLLKRGRGAIILILVFHFNIQDFNCLKNCTVYNVHSAHGTVQFTVYTIREIKTENAKLSLQYVSRKSANVRKLRNAKNFAKNCKKIFEILRNKKAKISRKNSE